jgi:hypothetical protein
MTIGFREGVSIGEIAIYSPALLVATYLSVRHGFGRSAGWMFLIIFCLARIIGAAMQLATITAPSSISLYTGYAILQNIGLSPLMLATLGLLSRLLDNINRTHHTAISTRFFKFVELIILVGLILGIVGGINASNAFVQKGSFTPGSLNKAGTALFIVSYVAIVLSTIFLSFSTSHASRGEKRIFVAVALSLPFLLVRLFYSIMSTFTKNKNFNLLTGNITILLCVAFIEELVIVILFEGVGLTLSQVPKDIVPEAVPMIQGADGLHYAIPALQQSRQSGPGQTALRIFRMTIVGRMVMSFFPNGNNRVGMRGRYARQSAHA